MAGTQASGKTPAIAGAAAKTVALVANQESGNSDPARCAETLARFGAAVRRFDVRQLERAFGEGAGGAGRAGTEGNAAGLLGVDRVVVAGGDGSVAPVAALAGEAGIPLAVLPVGTANDFAGRLGIPGDLTEACRLAVHGSKLRSLELGWMNGERPFVNVASAGLPAPAAAHARSWKDRLGPLAYALGALQAGATAKPLPCLVECEDEELLAGEAWQVTVAASGAFGAGAVIDEADPGDGALEVVAIEAGARLGLVTLAYRLRRGRVTGHPRAFHKRCGNVTVQVPDGTRFNVDGELVTTGDARFTAAKDAFRLVVG
jgi:YegS/Rv2252/BmrU family lipid kinase